MCLFREAFLTVFLSVSRLRRHFARRHSAEILIVLDKRSGSWLDLESMMECILHRGSGDRIDPDVLDVIF